MSGAQSAPLLLQGNTVQIQLDKLQINVKLPLILCNTEQGYQTFQKVRLAHL